MVFMISKNKRFFLHAHIYTVICFFAFCLFSNHALSATRQTSWYFAEYQSDSGSLGRLTSKLASEYPAPYENYDSGYVASQIAEIFKASMQQDWGVSLSDELLVANPKVADFQLIILRAPYLYNARPKDEAVYPDLKNKNKLTAAETRVVISPWMHAHLYLNDKKELIGGTILVHEWQYVKLKQLYALSVDDPGVFKMHDFKEVNEVAIEYNAYNRVLAKYFEDIHEIRRSRPGETPQVRRSETDKKLQRVFGGDERDLFLARLMASSAQRERGMMGASVMKKAKQCGAQSTSFYLKLYAANFKFLKSQEPSAAFHQFAPDKGEMASIIRESGDFNCFESNAKN